MEQEIESVDVSIKWPFKWTLVGSSGSGKTNFALNIIKRSYTLFDQKPDRVIIIYKVFQEIYNTFDNYYPTSLYTEEECDFEELTKSNTERLLIICDDLYFSKKLDEISEYFLIKGRHRNSSWIVLTQSIFNQPALKNISRNSTHMTLFKNVRLNEPHILFSQLRPRSSKVLQNIYAEATEKPYGYLDIDLSQTCPDKLRYKTNLFDSIVKVFVIMSDTSFKTMYLVNKSLLDKNQNFKLSIRNQDICSDGMNVTVKPIKQRKSKQINVNEESENFDDNIDKDGSTDANNDDDSSDDDKQRSKYNSNHENRERVDPTHLKPQYDPVHQSQFDPSPQHTQHDFNQPANRGSSSLKRKKPNSFYQKNRITKRTKIPSHTSPSREKASKNKMKRYQLNKYEKRFKKMRFNDSSLATTQNHHQNQASSIHQRIESDSDNQSINDSLSERVSNENNETEIQENTSPMLHDQNEKPIGQRIGNKRQKIEDKSDDQWISGLKSRLNERRVQFKRKDDTIGYRVLPDDEHKSIIKPTDFKFLDPVTSSELLGKWKPLKELKRKQPSTKRLKPLRSFSIWKEPNN